VAGWSDQLAALITRGVDANAVQVVVSDGSTGLPAALSTKLPRAQQQRCVVHKIRGLERAFCYCDMTMTAPTTHEALTHEAARLRRRQQLSTEAHAIFAAPARVEAEARLALFRTTWSTLEPEVVQLLTKDLNACLTFYQCDQTLHPLIRSTNLRTYAVARLCAIPACGKPRRMAHGFIRNCPRHQIRDATRALSLVQQSRYSPASVRVGPGV
jgi:putative transposase